MDSQQQSVIFRRMKEDEVMICSCPYALNKYNEQNNRTKKHLFFSTSRNVLGKMYHSRNVIMDDISAEQKIYYTNDLGCGYYEAKFVKEQEGILPFFFFID